MTNFADLKQSDLDRQKRQEYVTQLFDNLAPRYDRFNRAVSLFRDEAWRNKTIQLLGENRSGAILDLAAGTGDLAHSALRLGARQVHVFDISREMLTFAKEKFRRQSDMQTNAAFELGSAESLPFKEGAMDGVVSGFAMRNVFHFLDDVLAEVYRVLKPGGSVAILELSQPDNPLLRHGFRLHMKIVMPAIGKLTTGDSAPFAYLRETTMTFLTREQFKRRLERAGFMQVKWHCFMLGAIAVHYGTKPHRTSISDR